MKVVNHRRKMLDAVESNANGNDNFAIKMVSTENVEGKSYIFKKKYGRSKNKQSDLFFPFSKLLSWATILKVTLSGIVWYV